MFGLITQIILLINAFQCFVVFSMFFNSFLVKKSYERSQKDLQPSEEENAVFEPRDPDLCGAESDEHLKQYFKV